MSNDQRNGLTIEELSTAVDLPVRTIRYYIAEGLIGGPAGRGKAAVYGPDQLTRLRLVRKLANERLPLAEVKERLSGISSDDVAALLRAEESRSTEIELARVAPSPKEYVAALLRNARAARELPPNQALNRSIQSAPVPRRSIEEPSTAFDLARSGQRSRPPGDHWEHWELAPGVVLQVRTEARVSYRDLIDRLLHEAERHEPRQR